MIDYQPNECSSALPVNHNHACCRRSRTIQQQAQQREEAYELQIRTVTAKLKEVSISHDSVICSEPLCNSRGFVLPCTPPSPQPAKIIPFPPKT